MEVRFNKRSLALNTWLSIDGSHLSKRKVFLNDRAIFDYWKKNYWKKNQRFVSQCISFPQWSNFNCNFYTCPIRPYSRGRINDRIVNWKVTGTLIKYRSSGGDVSHTSTPCLYLNKQDKSKPKEILSIIFYLHLFAFNFLFHSLYIKSISELSAPNIWIYDFFVS